MATGLRKISSPPLPPKNASGDSTPTSTSTSKQTNSLATGQKLPAFDQPRKTGSLPSLTGVTTPSNFLTPGLSLSPLSKEEIKSWLLLYERLATTPSLRSLDNPDQTKKEIQNALTRLSNQPATSHKVIGRMIDHLCEIMGSNSPSEVALASYLVELEPYPKSLLVEAFRRVSRTHKYPRFPFIADFLNAIEPEIEEQKRLHLRLNILLKMIR